MANLIPPGDYNAVVTRVADEDGEAPIARWGAAKTGTKFALLYFEIIDGPFAGQKLPWWGYFGKESGKRTLQSLRYCGFKGADLTKLDDQSLNQKVSVNVEHNTNPDDPDAKVRARIAWVNRFGGASAMKLNQPLSAVELRAFAAQVRSRLDGIAEVEGDRWERPAAAAGPSEPASGYLDDPGPCADDDIPF